MDKSWMKIQDRRDSVYRSGVDRFIKFAYHSKEAHIKIPCPCTKCNNFRNQTKEVVRDHLVKIGIRKSYVRWIYHGEAFKNDSDDYDYGSSDENSENSDEDEINGMLNDIGTARWGDHWPVGEEQMTQVPNEKENEADAFIRLLEDAKKDLYPGCKNFSKLSFIVALLHLKTMSGWTAKSFDTLLEVFRTALPDGALVPKSFYDAKKVIRDLGFNSEKIHACVNDCVLFRKEFENLDTCPNDKCKESRYKSAGSKVPRKVLRYFPLTPRLRRLYINKEIANDMRWHKEKRVEDSNIMRHPADCEAWKHLDQKYELFAQDPRNVRLGLATDGFNPFGNLSNAYSIWPVFIVPYNLPPWKCMKDPFFFMSLLIPGPKSPGNDIDVYFQPLIDEFKDLWNGVEAYDAYKGEKFTLRAALLWTINDFPAYAMVSGWSTKGYLACPICMSETSCAHLPIRNKLVYAGHRRFLPTNHHWRKEKKAFNGEVDYRDPVKPLSGEEILEQLHSIEKVEFGKTSQLLNQRKRKRNANNLNWTKKSVFFELLYWADLRVRHNLDIMHIVKNVSESIFGTIMDIEDKTRDHWKVREDLKQAGLKKDLHLIPNGDSYIMPMGCYNLTKDEKSRVCDFLASIKYPDGFASNISRCIKGGQFHISGMKSHDFHIFIQRIMPLAIRGSLSKEVRQVLFELSAFFKKLCSRTLYVDLLEEQEKSIVVILCKLERLFPPSFFDIMIHLLVHLPTETKIAGPPQYRWMFPFERKMSTLKGYVNNKARPEGCIAERYIDNECSIFCSMYLHNIDTIFNRVERNYERKQQVGELSVFSCNGHAFGGPKLGYMTRTELAKIHIFVLNNCDEIEDFINEHKILLDVENSANVDQRHDKEFPNWFQERVLNGPQQYNDELRSLARGPDNRVRRYSGCLVNGYRFHTRDREKERKTQNSGVMVKGEHGNNTMDFYGVIKDIIEVEYLLGKRRVLLFKCDWWKVADNSGIQIDKDWGIISVNVSKKWYEDQPYVLANQVQQVFYVQDLKLGKNWYVVEQFSPRNSYDVPVQLDKEQADEVYQEEEPEEVVVVTELDEAMSLGRKDYAPLNLIDSSVVQEKCSEATSVRVDEDFINDDVEQNSSFSDDEDEDIWTDHDSDSD